VLLKNDRHCKKYFSRYVSIKLSKGKIMTDTMKQARFAPEHLEIHPSILYAGNPVSLITTLNRDGETNISPMSSVWELGDRLVLGIVAATQCYENLRREGECVANFPSSTIWRQVEQLARATGRNPVPEHKQAIGYYYAPDKFDIAEFTPQPSADVKPFRIAECALQFEAKLCALHQPTAMPAESPTAFGIFEMQVTRVHAHSEIVIPGTNYINTANWSPLLYVFRHYFGTGPDLGRTFRAEA
jgi:flavin reductase (DIM6/NTAB) family NADH-FMN oxidoreductase RutF